MAKEDRGFASMDRAKQREIASKGGKAAHQKGTAHEWTSEEARDAGRKGGIASHQRRREQGDSRPTRERSRWNQRPRSGAASNDNDSYSVEPSMPSERPSRPRPQFSFEGESRPATSWTRLPRHRALGDSAIGSMPPAAPGKLIERRQCSSAH